MAQRRTRTFNLININDRSYDLSSISSGKTSSLDDSNVTTQSFSDDSLLSDTQEIRRSRHYIKQSKSNRIDDHITSLKRRVRKQQLIYGQNEVTNFPSLLSTHLPLILYSQQPATSSHHRTNKSRHIVPLPPLINNPRFVRIRARGIKLNTGG